MRNGLEHLKIVSRPALLAAPKTFLADIRATDAANGLQKAVVLGDSKAIFQVLVRTMQYQGISDAAADGFTRKHGHVYWDQIAKGLQRAQLPASPQLLAFLRLSLSKVRADLLTSGCNADLHRRSPAASQRNSESRGRKCFSIYSRCVRRRPGWLARSSVGRCRSRGLDHRTCCCEAVLEPLKNIHGVSDKVLGMALADLLLGSDPQRHRWIVAGATMIAIDTLVHAFLHRTGVLRRAGAKHSYGSACYAPGGCAEIIATFAQTIDARQFNSEFPAYFPRFLQHAIWRFCAQGVMNVCNGNQIKDNRSCENSHCPNYDVCDRLTFRFL